MFWKLIVVIIVAAAVGAGLLALRQQRFELAHDLVKTQVKIDQSKWTISTLHARLAGRLEEHSLEDAIARAQLQLEPIVPVHQFHSPNDVRVAERPRPSRHGD
jgi:hypothetical protein